MCRPSETTRSIVPRSRRLAAAAIVACLLSATAAGQQELAGYLERLGLSRLLIEHYERELAAGAIGDERTRIVNRLAEAYPEQLERETDAARRAALLERSQAFLNREQPKEADALRLALLRVRYRDAARTAEDLRAALVDDSQRDGAIATLEAVGAEVVRLRQRLESRQRDLDRRSDRTSGLQGEVALERADRVRGLVQETASLEAWALYYRAVLTGDATLAEAAQPIFGRIVDASQNYPTPKDVSLDLRANDFYANAILGLALAKSRTESIATTMEWLALLEEPRTSAAIRAQLPAWRLVASIDRGEWGQARGLLAALAGDASTPIAWLRIAAVGGLRAPASAPYANEARQLSREAIAALASRRELAHVADLARRFGDEVLGGEGFAPSYVRGILRYEEGRTAREASDASRAAAAFRAALEELDRALAASDVERYPVPAATARGLIGWSRFELGEFEAALQAFDAASDAAAGHDEESEWMGLVSVEKLIAARPGGDPASLAAATEDLRRRIDRFLALFPGSARVGQLIQRRLTLQGVPRREDLERLLAVDDLAGGGGGIEGKRQAVDGYYRLYRACEPESRKEIGRRFLDAALALPPRESRLKGLPAGDLTVARQVLEVSLAPELDDAALAETVIDRVEALLAAGELGPNVDARELGAELALRRVQLELAKGKPIDALVRLGDLENAGNAFASHARLARRHVFRWSSTRLSDGATSAPREQVVAAAWRSGIGLVDASASERGSLAASLAEPIELAIAERVFQSGVEVFARSGDREVGERALALGEALRVIREKDATLLEGIASLAARLGRTELAIECLRQVVAGSPIGSERWYRSKVAFVEVLAATDQRRARAVLDQHKAMQPDFGPAPYGDRLRELDGQVPGGGTPATEPSGEEPTS